MSIGEQRVLMAVHAHPDDECISTGGILARYSAEGARTVLVTCTGGEEGEISNAALATTDNLHEVRARELADSVALLGVGRSYQLGFRDSGMAGTEANDNPASFNQASLDDAVGRLVAVVRAEKPQVLVTYDEFGGYGHPDHIRAHQIAELAFFAAADATRYPASGAPWRPRKLYYAAFMRSEMQRFAERISELGLRAPWSAPTGGDTGRVSSFGVEDRTVTTSIDVSAHVESKRAALAAHRTQMGPENIFMQIPPKVIAQLWTHEHFQRRFGPGPMGLWDNKRETDLFFGLDELRS